jgi:ABC-type transport system involved in multi-copper enzyme maturation permease subunit
MLPGPIFNVELLTSARRARYFLVRAAYAAVLLVALWVVYQSMTGVFRFGVQEDDIHAVARFSAAFFSTFAVLQLLAVVLLGPAMVAGTIATERERRTIEYLFASSLSNAEIVLGKLAAKMLHVVYIILAGIPVLALVMLLGGIAPEALLVLSIITLTTVLTVSTISIAVSVGSARARDGVTRAYLVLFVLLAIPPMLLSLKGQWVYDWIIGPVNEQFVLANPFAAAIEAVVEASGANRAAALHLVLAFVRNHLIVSFVLATAATLSVRRAHLNQRSKSKRRRWRLLHYFRPAVGNRPMLWKEIFAEPAASRLGMVGRIALAVIVLAVIGVTFYTFFEALATGNLGYRTAGQSYLQYAVTMGAFLCCGGLLLVASRAAASIASEKERDCWTSLIGTPLEPGEIIWAKIAGSLWFLRGLVLLLFLIWGLGVLLDPQFLIAIPFLLGTFLLLALYAAALGVSFSLRCRSSLRAMGATLAIGLVVGGGYMFCCVPLMAVGRAEEGMILSFAPCIPFLLALPGIVYMDGEHFLNGREGGIMLFAYILGMIGYGVTWLLLTGGSISNFDKRAGRTRLTDSSGWGAPVETPVEAVVVPPPVPPPAPPSGYGTIS